MTASIPVEIGDCFHLPDKYRRSKRHLCVCIARAEGPPPEVMLVPLVTQRDWSDTSVVLQPGVHPFVKNPTVVDFRYARVELLSKLEDGIAQGRIKRDERFPPSIMSNIRKGISKSAFTPNYMIERFKAMNELDCGEDSE